MLQIWRESYHALREKGYRPVMIVLACLLLSPALLPYLAAGLLLNTLCWCLNGFMRVRTTRRVVYALAEGLGVISGIALGIWDAMRAVPPMQKFQAWVLAALTVVALVMLGLIGCTKQPELGPVINPATIAQPDPVAPPVAEVVIPTAPVPTIMPDMPDTWRAWIPREQTVNGDVIEGHYLVISPQSPALEEIEPTHPMPRPPRSPMVSAPMRQGKAPTTSSATPQAPAPIQPSHPLTPPGYPMTPPAVPQTPVSTKPPTAYSQQLAEWQRLLFPQPTAGGEVP